MLSQKQLTDRCLLFSNGADQCRYLEQDDNDLKKHYCRKQRKEDKAKIDKKLSEFVADCRKQKVNPKNQGVPLGDNCHGYPLLKFVEQGYDKP